MRTCHLRTICSALLMVRSWLEICFQGNFMRCTTVPVAIAASGPLHTHSQNHSQCHAQTDALATLCRAELERRKYGSMGRLHT